jgi:hypothetical protein
VLSRAEIAAVMRDGPPEFRWAVRWQYLRGDGFFDLLLQAAAHADAENLALIGLGFSDLARAVHSWKNVPGWAQGLEAWARARAAQEVAP